MYKRLCMWLCVSTCLVMQLCLACETSPAACVSSPGCADPPLHLSSLSVPLLPSPPAEGTEVLLCAGYLVR